MYANSPGLQRGDAYGSFGKGFAPKDRKYGINILALVVNFLVPILIFLVVLASLSFKLHNELPALTFIIVVCCLQLVFVCGFMAWNVSSSNTANNTNHQPVWYTFLFLMGLIAWISAVILGLYNYSINMAPYYDVNSLNAHSGVNPLTIEGQQLMDAGIINFDKNAYLDISRSMAFRNSKEYCVAPVTLRNASSQVNQFDFWAVGTDCCKGHRGNFKCGEYSNPFAHAGLRVIREDLSAFYRLAVQQAEAAFNIEAHHPIFVQWVLDPIVANEVYLHTGVRWFLTGLYIAGIVQAIMLALVSLFYMPFQ